MKFFFAMIAIFGFTGLVNAWGPGWNESEILAVVTITTDIYTTFCPEQTTFTQGAHTYTATKSQTITITDCPCTFISKVPKPTYPPVIPPPAAVQTPPQQGINQPVPIVPISQLPDGQIQAPGPGNPAPVPEKPTSAPPAPVPESPVPVPENPAPAPPAPVPESPVTVPENSAPPPPPVSSETPVPVPENPTSTPPSIGTNVPVSPPLTTSTPLQVTSAAMMNIPGFGAVALAGLAIILL